MKRTTFCAVSLVALCACGTEAAGPSEALQASGDATSSGDESGGRTIARFETREGTWNIRSTADGVRYRIGDSEDYSLDRLRREQPDFYDIITNSTALTLHGIDARVDRSFLERRDRDTLGR